jgi:hypothetical protein
MSERSRTSWQLALPAIAGAALVLPFWGLEAINTSGFRTAGFPVVLFAGMWLLGASFVFVAAGTMRAIRSDQQPRPTALRLVPRVALTVSMAGLWIGLVVDQMPCFLGVPNCD